MADAKEDKDLADFFDSLIADPTERKILKLVLQGTEDDAIIEDLMRSPNGEESASSSRRGERP